MEILSGIPIFHENIRPHKGCLLAHERYYLVKKILSRSFWVVYNYNWVTTIGPKYLERVIG